MQAIARAVLADPLRVLTGQVALPEAASANIAVVWSGMHADPVLLRLILLVLALAIGAVEDCGERRGDEEDLHFGGEEGALPDEWGRDREDVAEDVCNGNGSEALVCE